MTNTVLLRLTESSTIELPIAHKFAEGLVLAGDDTQGYEIVHTVSGLGFINGSPEFKSRLMDYGRALSELKFDWSGEKPLQDADPDEVVMAQHLQRMYWEGLQAPRVYRLSQ